LPNEILHQIYEENCRDWNWSLRKPEWSDPKTLIAPLSKRLLDVQRRQLYKSVVLEGPRSLSRLARLIKTVVGRPAVGALIRDLRIHVYSEETCDRSEQIIRDELAAGGLNPFFHSLSTLKSVKLWGGTAAELEGLLEALSSDNLSPTCTYLSIFLPWDCFNRAHFLSPHLNRLRMSVYSAPLNDRQLLTPLAPGLPIPSFPLSNLSHLVIYGPDSHLSDWKNFLARCTRLTTIEIMGSDDLPIYTSILESVPVPTSVTSLSLWIQGFPDETDPRTLGAIHVSLLPNLRHLTFAGQGDYSQTLADARQNLQLETLTIDFQDGATVDSADLLDFLSSLPSDHSLRHLDLDVWTGKRGKRAAEVDMETVMSEALARIAVDWAEQCALSGWMHHELPDCLCEVEFSRIREIAFERGIEIGGTNVDALELQEEYRQESTEFRKMWNEWMAANPE